MFGFEIGLWSLLAAVFISVKIAQSVLLEFSPLDQSRLYRLDGGGGLDDGRPML